MYTGRLFCRRTRILPLVAQVAVRDHANVSAANLFAVARAKPFEWTGIRRG
jgi:hypothetical protein